MTPQEVGTISTVGCFYNDSLRPSLPNVPSLSRLTPASFLPHRMLSGILNVTRRP